MPLSFGGAGSLLTKGMAANKFTIGLGKVDLLLVRIGNNMIMGDIFCLITK